MPPSYTFDLFDTLVTRRCLRPEHLFWDVAARLQRNGLLDAPIESFFSARIAADTEARRRIHVEEITLDQIYDVLAEKYSWTDEKKHAAIQIEIESEKSAVIPIAEIAACWKLRDDAEKAIISDTYLDTQSLMGLLRECGINCDLNRLFPSSRFGCTKSQGGLYPLVAKTLGVDIASILHTGDNTVSDIQQAQRAGATANYFPYSHPTRYDSIYFGPGGHDRSLIAGALRAGRLQFPGGDPAQRSLWSVGSSIAAPLLLSYVLWVIEESKARGITHLYFLSRDGQVLLEIAKIIDPSLSCSYLLASRQAWHLPSITEIDAGALSWILADAKKSSLRQALSRVEINPGEIRQLLEGYGYAETQWDTIGLNLELATKLFEDSDLRSIIIDRASKARKRLLSYLRSEGVTDKDHVAIVDLGWHGRLQRSLSRILSIEAPSDGRKITGFYFSLAATPQESVSGQFCAYYDSSIGKKYALMLELMCAADHGGLRGFRQDEGTVSPILSAEVDTDVISWGLSWLRGGIFAAVDALHYTAKQQGLSFAEIGKLLKEPARTAFIEFVEMPEPQEAKAFGLFPFTFDQYHSQIVATAPVVSLQKTFVLMLLGSHRSSGIPTPWIEGTLVNSLPPWSRKSSLTLLRWRQLLLNQIKKIRR
jgi:predicted HAD superfamily hydrolase